MINNWTIQLTDPTIDPYILGSQSLLATWDNTTYCQYYMAEYFSGVQTFLKASLFLILLYTFLLVLQYYNVTPREFLQKCKQFLRIKDEEKSDETKQDDRNQEL